MKRDEQESQEAYNQGCNVGYWFDIKFLLFYEQLSICVHSQLTMSHQYWRTENLESFKNL